MTKKILMLGGAYAQIPIIQEAKKRGLYVITCDYLPENPGHKLADEYYNISTTDSEAVLELAKDIKPDFIVAYASDPAAPIAAFVSEKLGLPTNSSRCIQILSEKDLFRDFLSQNGFNAPKSIGLNEKEVDIHLFEDYQLPLIIKPTDSSGSKGVVKLVDYSEMKDAVEYALSFSRKKRVIVEEFIDTNGEQLHGDGYVIDGKLVFSYLGDHHYNAAVNPFVPYSTTWPSKQRPAIIREVEAQVQKIISLIGFKTGAVNIEARIYNDKVFIMEIGPRNGGNFVPQVLKWITNFDMVEASINHLLNLPTSLETIEKGIGAYYVLHSISDGILNEVVINRALNKYIVEQHQYIKLGEKVKSFQGSNAAVGVLLLKFGSYLEMKEVFANMSNLINVKVL